VLDELEIGWRLVPAPTYAVTGTNGKSTVAALSVAVLAAHGLDPALAGNTDFGPPLSALSLGPPPRSVVAEVSSYQAEGSPELVADAAVLTNLTPDHLDRYGTIEAYGDAKRKLFVRGERTVPLAVLNVDDPLGREIGGEVEARGGRVLRYGVGADADYRIGSWTWRERVAAAEVSTPGGTVPVRLRVPGAHHLANATAVLALADGLGLPRETTLATFPRAELPPGRCEMLDASAPFEVMFDRCYTPDSVLKALELARSLVEPRGGRLLVVLGLVGSGAPTVGRGIGAAARERSDHLILSGVSYRGEPRMITLRELAVGARAADGGPLEVFIDRRRAIARALELARPGDFVAILGRGAVEREATDARGGYRRLDDRRVVRELV
jgi:UDP-N-acetylmuramoyl-L-alanyl-D-glutamate--2,6-diaminopimelate ligase